ncbi:MAG: SDR family oxidoreductase, partial [Planctomycetales bacterium]|nr:SDR family oxidoreductase [Planctomycetales bacterium]
MEDSAMIARRQDLAGKVTVVTGGTSGIGQAACLALARYGSRVVVVGRDLVRLEETAARVAESHQLGESAVLGFRADVRSESDMRHMAEAAIDRFGAIDALVASAGILRAAGGKFWMFPDLPVEEWDEVVSTNLHGTFLSIRAVLPQMIRQRRGDVITISSKSGERGIAFDSPYCASKFAVIGLTQALAEEVRPYGIRVQTILPGPFESGVWGQNGPIPPPG